MQNNSNFTRIARILGGFDAYNTPRKSTEIIKELGVSRPTGFGLIRAMVQADWLERVDHGIVRLGPAAAQLMHIPIEADQALKEVAAAFRVVSAERDLAHSNAPRDDEWVPELMTLVDTQVWKREAPFRICFANAGLENVWRKAMLASMRYALRRHSDRISRFSIADADEDPKVQLAQVNAFAEEGMDLLIISQTTINDSELSVRLKELADRGLPIVAMDRRPSVNDSLVSFVTASDRRIGRVSATWMAERLKGQGRIWMLSGLEGASPAIRRQSAALSVFSDCPGIKVETVSYTNWTEEGGYTAVDRLLSQGASIPDGVWCDSGLQGIGSIDRFVEEGGPLPVHTGGDLNLMYKKALSLKIPFIALDYPAAMGARAVDTAIDILSGNPVPSRVEVPVQIILPRGCETASVTADIWAEAHVGWELPDDAILSQGPSLRTRVLAD